MAEIASEYCLKAFPLFGPIPDEPLPFDFHPSRSQGKGLVFSRPHGKAPEVMLRNIGWPVVRALLRESDIIVLDGIQALPAFMASILGRIMRKPLVVITQSMSPHAERQRSILIRLPKSVVLRLATICVAETPKTRATLIDVYGIPSCRILDAVYPGGVVDFEEHLKSKNAKTRIEFRNELGIPPESYVISFVGTLIYLKGVDILLKSFAALIKDHPNSMLMIIGPDGKPSGKRSELEYQARELGLQKHVLFLGERSRDDLAGLYLASDVFVLPSRKDVWPKVLMEAALAGLPLVTTEVCGSAGDMVREGVNGFITKVGDVQSLSIALIQLSDPDTRLRMGLASKEIVSRYKDISSDVKGYDAAIQKVLPLVKF